MDAATIDCKALEEVWRACRRVVGSPPECQTGGDRYRYKFSLFEYMNV